MGIAKITRNYQVTVPKDVRRIQDIKIGDTVLFAIEGDRVDFFKMNLNTIIKETAGIWKSTPQDSSINYVRRLRKGWMKRTKKLPL